MKRFSIITVTYNAERYVRQTLHSVQNQTFKNFEHIIWDGGSQDRTLEIVKEFPDVIVYQGQDLGIADAMNKGATRAQGEFLIHLHADDLLAHDRVLDFLDSALKQHPEVQWLYGKVSVIDEEGNRKLGDQKFHFFDYKRLKKYNCIAHPGVCIARELFWRYQGFDRSLAFAMDYDLWLRLGKKEMAFAFPAEIALFREHEQSLSTSLPKKVTEEAYLVRSRYMEGLWEKWSSYRNYRRRLKKHGCQSNNRLER